MRIFKLIKWYINDGSPVNVHAEQSTRLLSLGDRKAKQMTKYADWINGKYKFTQLIAGHWKSEMLPSLDDRLSKVKPNFQPEMNG